MDIKNDEFRRMIGEEQFSPEEIAAFSNVAELQRELSEIYEKYESARVAATTAYKSVIARRDEKMGELEHEIETLKQKVLGECKELCTFGIHIPKHNLSAQYVNTRVRYEGKYYCVYYCPICGEIFSAWRYPSHYIPTPATEIKRDFWGMVRIPRNSVMATDEIKHKSGHKIFIHKDYKISDSSEIVSMLLEELKKAEAELRETTKTELAQSQKLRKKIELIKSVLQQLSCIKKKQKEYRTLEEQPKSLCELFGHDIEYVPFNTEVSVRCKCCGKQVYWDEVEDRYEHAKLAGVIDLPYVKHNFKGILLEPRSVEYVYPRRPDSEYAD